MESKRIETAINDYIRQHGRPPKSLNVLVPDVLQSLPTFPEVAKMDYQLSADESNWALDLLRTNRNRSVLYRRTNIALSAEDEKRKIDVENGCYVLKVP